MKIFIFTILVFIGFNLQAANILDFKIKKEAPIYCVWAVPVTWSDLHECKENCHADCGIIYGPNYTGHNACVTQEFGYDCYCGTCY